MNSLPSAPSSGRYLLAVMKAFGNLHSACLLYHLCVTSVGIISVSVRGINFMGYVDVVRRVATFLIILDYCQISDWFHLKFHEDFVGDGGSSP